MNDLISATHNAVAPSPVQLELVEIMDADGNPTGQYEARPSEAASEETTIFAAEDDSTGHIIVH